MKNSPGDQKFFIGVDEAGYGPNLGPLVIAASVWKTPKNLTESELCDHFTKFCQSKRWETGCSYVPLGDSKELYQPATGLMSLETGLLAMLSLMDGSVDRLSQFVERFATFADDLDKSIPWYQDLERIPIPAVQTDVCEIERLKGIAHDELNTAGIELVECRAVLVTEGLFNRTVNELGSKGQLLSQQSLALAARQLEKTEGDIEIFCDRQGGRKNYHPVLFDAMPDEWFDEIQVTKTRSTYCNRGSRSIRAHFSVRGDQFPPTALASMLAKYLREMLMKSFNQYWQQHVPGIKATAGYPVDAARFRSSIEATAESLDLQQQNWWRCK